MCLVGFQSLKCLVWCFVLWCRMVGTKRTGSALQRTPLNSLWPHTTHQVTRFSLKVVFSQPLISSQHYISRINAFMPIEDAIKTSIQLELETARIAVAIHGFYLLITWSLCPAPPSMCSGKAKHTYSCVSTRSSMPGMIWCICNWTGSWFAEALQLCKWHGGLC